MSGMFFLCEGSDDVRDPDMMLMRCAWQVPCVAVESAVYGVVFPASAVLMVDILELGLLPGRLGVDSVVGVACISRCGHAG
jgi:hypothetical protein